MISDELLESRFFKRIESEEISKHLEPQESPPCKKPSNMSFDKVYRFLSLPGQKPLDNNGFSKISSFLSNQLYVPDTDQYQNSVHVFRLCIGLGVLCEDTKSFNQISHLFASSISFSMYKEFKAFGRTIFELISSLSSNVSMLTADIPAFELNLPILQYANLQPLHYRVSLSSVHKILMVISLYFNASIHLIKSSQLDSTTDFTRCITAVLQLITSFEQVKPIVLECLVVLNTVLQDIKELYVLTAFQSSQIAKDLISWLEDTVTEPLIVMDINISSNLLPFKHHCDILYQTMIVMKNFISQDSPNTNVKSLIVAFLERTIDGGLIPYIRTYFDSISLHVADNHYIDVINACEKICMLELEMLSLANKQRISIELLLEYCISIRSFDYCLQLFQETTNHKGQDFCRWAFETTEISTSISSPVMESKRRRYLLGESDRIFDKLDAFNSSSLLAEGNQSNLHREIIAMHSQQSDNADKDLKISGIVRVILSSTFLILGTIIQAQESEFKTRKDNSKGSMTSKPSRKRGRDEDKANKSNIDTFMHIYGDLMSYFLRYLTLPERGIVKDSAKLLVGMIFRSLNDIMARVRYPTHDFVDMENIASNILHEKFITIFHPSSSSISVRDIKDSTRTSDAGNLDLFNFKHVPAVSSIDLSCYECLLSCVTKPSYSSNGDGGVYYLKALIALKKWPSNEQEAIVYFICKDISERISRQRYIDIYNQSQHVSLVELDSLQKYYVGILQSALNIAKSYLAPVTKAIISSKSLFLECYDNLCRGFVIIMSNPRHYLTANSNDLAMKISCSSIPSLHSNIISSLLESINKSSSHGSKSLSSMMHNIWLDLLIDEWSHFTMIDDKTSSETVIETKCPTDVFREFRDVIKSVVPQLLSIDEGNAMDGSYLFFLISIRSVVCLCRMVDLQSSFDCKSYDSVVKECDDFLVKILSNSSNYYSNESSIHTSELLSICLLDRVCRNRKVFGNTITMGFYEKLLQNNLFCSSNFDHGTVAKAFANVISIAAIHKPKICCRIIVLLLSTWCQIVIHLLNDSSLGLKSGAIGDEIGWLSQTGVLRYFIVTYPDVFCLNVIVPLITSDQYGLTCGTTSKTPSKDHSVMKEINNSDGMDPVVEVLRAFIGMLQIRPMARVIDDSVSDNISWKNMVDIIFPTIMSMNPSISKLAVNRLMKIFPEVFKYSASNNPLVERHIFMYQLLCSSDIQNRSVHDLVHGDLWKIMTICSNSLKCPLYPSHGISPQAISSGIVTRTLLHILWDLGDEEKKRNAAIKALQIFCSLSQARVWSIPRSIIIPSKNKISYNSQDEKSASMNSLFEQNDASVEINAEKNVSLTLSEYFLYITSKLIQHNWSNKTNLEQAHSIRVLKSITKLLYPEEFSRYFPKVMTLLNLSLASLSPLVLAAGLDLLHELINRLSDEVYQQQIPSLVISLFDIVDTFPVDMNYDTSTTVLRNGCRDVYGSLKWSKDRLFIPYSNIYEGSNHPVSGHSSSSLSQESFSYGTTQLFEYFYCQEIISRVNGFVRSEVLGLIQDIIVTKSMISMNQIPFVPKIPELELLHSNNRKTLSQLTFEELISLYCDMLKHESPTVREKILLLLGDVIQINLNRIYMIINESSVRHSGDANVTNHHIVSSLMQTLLSMTSTESDNRVITALATCIGSLGAIDPSRISIVKTSNQLTATSQLLYTPPWDTTYEMVIIDILDTYLIPSLSADAFTQDRTGFAIQSLLQDLVMHFKSNDMIQSSANQSKESITSMPKEVKSFLEDKKVFQMVEPFWSSKYQYNSPDLVQPTIYRKGMSCRKWISDWLTWLISKNTSPLNRLYYACRGTLIKRIDLCQFLLPRLLIDVMISNYDNVTSKDSSSSNFDIFESIAQELTTVLSDGQPNEMNLNESAVTEESMSQDYHLCIQTIFSLLDCLSLWISKVSASNRKNQTLSKAILQSMNQNMQLIYESSVFSTLRQVNDTIFDGFYSNATAVAHILYHSVPSQLLIYAALKTKDYSRALRLFETDIRIADIRRRLLQSNSLSNQSNGGRNDQDHESVATVPLNSSISNANKKSDQLFKDTAITIKAKKKETDISDRADIAAVKPNQSISPPSETLNQDSSNMHRSNDGAHRSLPILQPKQLKLLLNIFSLLGDGDSVHGTIIMKQLNGYECSSYDRILELEETDNWNEALQEYGQLLYHSNRLRSDQMTETGDALDNGIGNIEDLIISANESFLYPERGRLRCLIELEQLGAVIDQTIGRRQRNSLEKKYLVPLGVEAAWKLTRWDDLEQLLSGYEDTKTKNNSEDEFNVTIGRGLLMMKRFNREGFNQVINQSKKRIMSSLAGASMESYYRSYPLISRLQVLHDLEKAERLYDLIPSTDKQVPNDAVVELHRHMNLEQQITSFQWLNRINMMSVSPHHRTTIISLHQSLYSYFNLSKLSAKHWYWVSDYYKSIRKFDMSLLAIRHAKEYGLDNHIVTLQECKILKETKNYGKAMMLIEPIEINTNEMRMTLDLYIKRNRSKDAAAANYLPDSLSSTLKRHQLAERILLATQIMNETKQKLGKGIANRYKLSIELKDKAWDQAHYEFARYHDENYVSYSNNDTDSSFIVNRLGMNSGSSNSSQVQKDLLYHDRSRCKSVVQALEHYARCVSISSRYLLQALPRFITLWLSFTSIRSSDGPTNAAGLSSNTKISGKITVASSAASVASNSSYTSKASEYLRSEQDKCNKLVEDYSKVIHPSFWYTCLPQLISRTNHPNPDSSRIIESIIVEVIKEFPHHGIWHLGGLIHSNNEARKKISKQILLNVSESMKSEKNRSTSSRIMLQDAVKLFRSFVDLATRQTNERRLKYSWPTDIQDIRSILVPTQTVLQSSFFTLSSSIASISSSSYLSMDGDTSLSSQSSSNLLNVDKFYFQSIDENVDVAISKAKPKTIHIRTICGKRIKFLVKQEKQGDLRKDARMMEFNSIVNRLLTSSHESRSKKLRLRTFSVICLSEECGILEWVNNTSCIRHIIMEAHGYYPDGVFPQIDFKSMFQLLPELQKQYEFDISGLVKRYRQEVSEKYKPCLSRWFLETFRDATSWYETRHRFIRSCSVWSVIGYVVGLGDRHSENILLDITNGECVHVDFDCLFDKGLTLARPELVPFRLTSNIVDAMGLTGIQGGYQINMEICMTILRENKETLMSVLEPFLRDPTVAWLRSGRAAHQRSHASSIAESNDGRGSVLHFQDHENAEAKETLNKISARLSGVYNISHPFAEKIAAAYQGRKEPLPDYGLGAAKDEGQPLSVVGQVQRLIVEATCEENLAQMYIGWQPWL